jgi:hypothetical protein
VELSKLFDSVKEGELWVQRHRSIDALSPVSLLVEARSGNKGVFFNPVGDAVVTADKPLGAALSTMLKTSASTFTQPCGRKRCASRAPGRVKQSESFLAS